MSKKIIRREEKIPVLFSEDERTLILEHTLADDVLTEPLEQALADNNRLTVPFTLDDLDDLMGFITAEANHTEDRDLREELEALLDRLGMI